METKNGYRLIENTGSVQARQAEYVDLINFYEAHNPALPAVAPGKPAPVDGQPAYAVDGSTGTASVLDGDVVVNGRWVRVNEWSSAPWSEDERAAFYAAHLERSMESRLGHDATMRAYGERRKLARQFTGH